MDLILSIPDELFERARRKAEAMGATVNRLLEDYLVQLSRKATPEEIAAELESLSFLAHGNSRGEKFNREQLYEER